MNIKKWRRRMRLVRKLPDGEQKAAWVAGYRKLWTYLASVPLSKRNKLLQKYGGEPCVKSR